MLVPDPTKIDAFLRRLFDPSIYNKLIYFEEAVLSDSITLEAKGYYIFVICEEIVYYCTLKDKRINPSQSIKFSDIYSIETLNDAAKFFELSTANETQHIKITLNPQSNNNQQQTAAIDFYSFYQDSKLFHYMYHSWIAYNCRLCNENIVSLNN
jgi:hypothetical protein